MKLRHSPTSPFVRKVVWCAHELGLMDRIEVIPTDAWSRGTDLVAQNPLSKVPTLLLDDGEVLYDSPVICAYLDVLGGNKLIPAVGDDHWRVRRLEALADGIMDAAVLVFVELNRRPEAQRWAAWIEDQRAAIRRSVDQLEEGVAELDGNIGLGQIAVATALAYLDLRGAIGEWRAEHPRLAEWFSQISARDGFAASAPPA